MDNIDLVASYWTVAGAASPASPDASSPVDFKTRAEAVSRAGYKGMEIWHHDLEHILEKHTLEEIKQVLDDNGLIHVEFEFLEDWFLEGEAKRTSDIRKQILLEASGVLGARHIKVGDFFQKRTPMPQIVENFAALCFDASEYETNIVFELMPFTMIDTLEEALEMVSGAGADNAGIIFDIWHMVKLGVSYSELAKVPTQYILGVELNDGFLASDMDLVEETTTHRQLCGQGEFDVPGFIEAVHSAGYRGPYGVEVLSADLRNRPVQEAAVRSFDTTMEQFKAARLGPV